MYYFFFESKMISATYYAYLMRWAEYRKIVFDEWTTWKKNRKARSYRWTSHVSASMVLSSPTGNNQRYEQIFIGSRMMGAHVFRSSQRNRTSRAAKLECDSCAS